MIFPFKTPTMKVQFIQITNEGEHKAEGQAYTDKNGKVQYTTDVSPLIKHELREYGILYNGKTWYPEDGEAFLKKLPLKYSGSRFLAKVIEE